MKTKVLITWFFLAAIVTVSACGGGTPATEPPAGTEPATEQPTEAPVTEPPTETEAPATEAPATETPDEQIDIPGEEVVQQLVAYTLPAGASGWTIPIKVAAFIDMENQPYGTSEDFEGFSPVGVVEIGPGSTIIGPGIYLVTIQLGETGSEIPGRIYQFTEENRPDTGLFQDITFEGVLQDLNPARKEAPFDTFDEINTDVTPPPDVSTGIGADSVCFVVKVNEDPTYIRYCSLAGSLLSVRTIFESQYDALIGSINEVQERLKENGYFNPDAVVLTDQIISEKEDLSGIILCRDKLSNPAMEVPAETPTAEAPPTLEFPNPESPLPPTFDKPNLAFSQSVAAAEDIPDDLQQVCGSDITVAPLEQQVPATYPESQSRFSPPAGQFMFLSLLASPFRQLQEPPQTVAVIKILHPIDTDPANDPGDASDIIQPGDYQVDYWYDSNSVFQAATISGVTNDDVQVRNQPIPAVPATFINQNDDDSPPPDAQISVCRILGVCILFQRTCT